MINRLRVFFLVGLLLVAGLARADYPATTTWYFGPQSTIGNTDPQKACTAFVVSVWPGGRCEIYAFGTGSWKGRAFDAKGDYQSSLDAAPRQTCPSGGNLQLASDGRSYVCTGVDLCNAGVRSTVQMDYGVIADGDWAKASKTVNLPRSYKGCYVKPVEVIRCGVQVSTGHTVCQYVVENTGDKGTAGNGGDGSAPTSGAIRSQNVPPMSADKNGACPKGTVQGGIDSAGTPICIGTGTNPKSDVAPTSSTSTPVSTVTNPDGSTTATSSVSSPNSDGSTTTTTTVVITKTDGTRTTTTSSSTSTKPDGSQGKPDTSSGAAKGADGKSGSDGKDGKDGKDAEDFCQAHPELNVCKNSTVEGGCSNGSSSVACEGDAIQCATLRAAVAIQCDQQKIQEDLKASSQYSLGKAAAEGNDPMSGTLPTRSNALTVDVPTSLDQSGWLGSGSGLADVSFTAQGRSFALPFSKLNPYLVALRYAIMIIALYRAFQMLSGAVLKD